MRWAGLALLISLMAGCALAQGGLGALPPVDIDCKGRATIMGGPYALTADCGEGFSYRRKAD